MKFPWQKYETTEDCRWCGGTGMHTRDDLGEHPDDVGRMHTCRICKNGKVTIGLTWQQYVARVREVWTGGMAYREGFLKRVEKREK